MKFTYLIEKEGYGPSKESWKITISKGVKLIFTVDCGTLSLKLLITLLKIKLML